MLPIIEYIISSFGQKDINFHFEAAGELFGGSLQELLGNAPPGLIQFEIEYNQQTGKPRESKQVR